MYKIVGLATNIQPSGKRNFDYRWPEREYIMYSNPQKCSSRYWVPSNAHM